MDLHAVVVAKIGQTQLSGERRLALLERANGLLAPILDILKADPDRKNWVEHEITHYLVSTRDNIQFQIARERVDNVQLGVDKRAAVPGDADPHAEKSVLRAGVEKLITTLALLNEQVIRLGHDQIHHFAHELAHGKVAGIEKRPGDLGYLVEIQNLLFVLDGMLVLSDEELSRELAHRHGALDPASTVEFLKGVVEITGGTVVVVFSYAAVLAKLTGATKLADEAMSFARLRGMQLGSIVAGIEMAHGLAVLLDGRAADQKKVEAVRDIAAGGAWFAGRQVAGAAAGAAGSIAVLLAYKELELMSGLYGQSLVGITAIWMNSAFKTMGKARHTIADSGLRLAKAGYLAAAESDIGQHAALAKVEVQEARSLAGSVDRFLETCEPMGYGPGSAYNPGAYKSLRNVFEPLARLKGATTPQSSAQAATEVLRSIDFCFEHANELLRDEAGLARESEATEGTEK